MGHTQGLVTTGSYSGDHSIFAFPRHSLHSMNPLPLQTAQGGADFFRLASVTALKPCIAMEEAKDRARNPPTTAPPVTTIKRNGFPLIFYGEEALCIQLLIGACKEIITFKYWSLKPMGYSCGVRYLLNMTREWVIWAVRASMNFKLLYNTNPHLKWCLRELKNT